MKSLLVVLALVVALGGVAHAAPLVTAPTGWTMDPEQSSSLAVKSQGVSHFGDTAIVAAEAYLAQKPGVALFVTRATVIAKDDGRDARIRAEVDELHATSQRAAASGSGVQEDGWSERVDPDAKLVEATLAWRDTSSHTAETARLVIVGSKVALISVTGECLARDDADPATIAACKAALATIDPGLDARDRIVPVLAPPGAKPPAATTAPTTSTMSESHTPLPPISVPREQPTADRRPVFVGAGIIALAAAFWWNRRRRAQYEREDAEKDKPR